MGTLKKRKTTTVEENISPLNTRSVMHHLVCALLSWQSEKVLEKKTAYCEECRHPSAIAQLGLE